MDLVSPKNMTSMYVHNTRYKCMYVCVFVHLDSRANFVGPFSPTVGFHPVPADSARSRRKAPKKSKVIPEATWSGKQASKKKIISQEDKDVNIWEARACRYGRAQRFIHSK